MAHRNESRLRSAGRRSPCCLRAKAAEQPATSAAQEPTSNNPGHACAHSRETRRRLRVAPASKRTTDLGQLSRSPKRADTEALGAGSRKFAMLLEDQCYR